MHKKALALNEALGRKQGMARAYGNLGNVYATRGGLADACSYCNIALNLYREVGMKREIAEIESRMRDAGCSGSWFCLTPPSPSQNLH
jgi:hypothetical protein